jgi:hypothetical protein
LYFVSSACAASSPHTDLHVNFRNLWQKLFLHNISLALSIFELTCNSLHRLARVSGSDVTGVRGDVRITQLPPFSHHTQTHTCERLCITPVIHDHVSQSVEFERAISHQPINAEETRESMCPIRVVRVPFRRANSYSRCPLLQKSAYSVSLVIACRERLTRLVSTQCDVCQTTAQHRHVVPVSA